MKDHASHRFTLVFVHRNGLERLLNVLESAEAAIDASLDEIIVVDNHSTDHSIEQMAARFPRVKIIQNHCNAGYARACNQGIAAGQGEFFLLCNNDIQLPRNILTQFAEDFSRYPRAGLIAAQLIKPDGSFCRPGGQAPGFLSELGLKPSRDYDFPKDVPSEIGAAVGACMGVRRSAIADAGGLDEDFFFYFEETEWCVRLARKKWAVLFEPRVQISHVGSASASAYFKGARIEFFRSRMLYWQKTLPRWQVLVLYAWQLPNFVLEVSFYSVMTLLTLGLSLKMRNKLLDRLVTISWLMRGRPKQWGLPDKCSQ